MYVFLHHLFLIWGITSWWSSGIKLSYCISLQLCYLKLLINLNVVHSHCFFCIFIYSQITRHVLSLILFLIVLYVIIFFEETLTFMINYVMCYRMIWLCCCRLLFLLSLIKWCEYCYIMCEMGEGAGKLFWAGGGGSSLRSFRLALVVWEGEFL